MCNFEVIYFSFFTTILYTMALIFLKPDDDFMLYFEQQITKNQFLWSRTHCTIALFCWFFGFHYRLFWGLKINFCDLRYSVLWSQKPVKIVNFCSKYQKNPHRISAINIDIKKKYPQILTIRLSIFLKKNHQISCDKDAKRTSQKNHLSMKIHQKSYMSTRDYITGDFFWFQSPPYYCPNKYKIFHHYILWGKN